MIKRIDLSIITGWVFVLTLSSLCFSQAIAAQPFISLLREFDLNEATQNDYAITATEYEQLQSSWQGLAKAERNQMLYGAAGEFWTNTFVIVLFHDLNNGMSWEAHCNNVTNYRVRPRGLSLTLSRFDRPISLKTARRMLADLLHKEASLFNNGRLQLDEEIKTQAVQRAGEKARQRLEKWEQLINECQNLPEREKLKAVNHFFNRQITQRDDELTEINCDYWQSPIETLARGIGDCDDFAMAKYVSLRLLGFAPEQLLVAGVEVASSGIFNHALLFVYSQNEADPLVLDNLTGQIQRLSMRTCDEEIKPIYGLNERQVKLFQEGLYEEIAGIESPQQFSKFGLALLNSQRLLPPVPGDVLAFLY
jgi:predicted transglutaminase-like cysteine proteinase